MMPNDIDVVDSRLKALKGERTLSPSEIKATLDLIKTPSDIAARFMKQVEKNAQKTDAPL